MNLIQAETFQAAREGALQDLENHWRAGEILWVYGSWPRIFHRERLLRSGPMGRGPGTDGRFPL